MFSLLHPVEPIDLGPLKQIKWTGNLVSNSSEVERGDVFFAYKGLKRDGRDHIGEALERGASGIIFENGDGFDMDEPDGVITVGIPDLRQRAGIVADLLLDHPSSDMTVVGVTGTNGKTSVSQWVAQAFTMLRRKCAVIGTLGNGFMDDIRPSDRTTPDPVPLQQLLSDFCKAGAQAVSMEVSSHALEMYRVNGVHFEAAIFTNLTRDHLDFHGTMENYAEAKFNLFEWMSLQKAIINIDDDYGRLFVKRMKADGVKTLITTYGFSEDADVRIVDCRCAPGGSSIRIRTPWGESVMKTRMLGRFNALNMAAIVALLIEMDVDLDFIVDIVARIAPTRGRMETIHVPGKPTVVVDYSHTPDSLEKALETLRDVKAPDRNLLCVFGCGGDRDRGKRPIMGRIATSIADGTVITSDNPRTENPMAIIDEITENGRLDGTWKVEPDRADAIAVAIDNAQEGDIILIAGKGHETYQEINGKRHHFDDVEVAKYYLGAGD